MSDTEDPAVEAAKRAERQSRWWESGNQTAWDVDYAEAAAREALAPIRELHKPGTEAGYEDEPYCETCGHYDGGLSADFTHQPWPCDTARLIYTSEELNDE